MNIIQEIKKETGIDVTLKCRKRANVELKSLASYVLRKKGLSLQIIANELNLNHATIIHHLKIYNDFKRNNKELEVLEELLTGIIIEKKPDDSLLVTEFNRILNEKNKEIAELKSMLEQYSKNNNIKRLVALLDNENIEMKFKAFVDINEKARYYPKFD